MLFISGQTINIICYLGFSQVKCAYIPCQCLISPEPRRGYRALTGNLSPYPLGSLNNNCIILECPYFNIYDHSHFRLCSQGIWVNILWQGNKSNSRIHGIVHFCIIKICIFCINTISNIRCTIYFSFLRYG